MALDKKKKLYDDDPDSFLYSMQQRNLVYNYNFSYYSNKVTDTVVTFNHPDGWVYSDPGDGGSIGLNSTNDCCMIVTGSGDSLMSFSQALHEFPGWQSKLCGQTVTASFHLNISDNSDISVSLSDGVTTSSKTAQTNGDIVFTLQLTVAKEAKKVNISIQCTSPGVVINISKVYANIGDIAIENLLCIVNGVIGERKQYIATENPPAEELSLCNESIELSANYTRLDSVLNKRFGAGSNKRSLLPDMRGYFSRAWDNDSGGIDPDAKYRTAPGKGSIEGDHVSTVESDAFALHDHRLSYSADASILTGKEGGATAITPVKSSNTEQRGGRETRPKNIAELYTIKWA